jgi:hypothetical protein
MRSAVTALILLGFVAACRGSAQVKADVEFWSELDVSAKLSDSIALTMFGLDRSSLQLANPQLGGVGVVADFRANNLLTFSLGYIYAGLPNIGKGFTVDAPLAAVSLGQAFGRWSIRERSRVERLYGVPGDPYRYREKVDISYAVLPRFHLFANDEVFYQFGIDRWNQNRAQVGFNRVINEAVSVDLFYLQRNTASEPKNTKGLGATVHLSFSSIGKKP